jgi:Kae1-associated kinase Bud32
MAEVIARGAEAVLRKDVMDGQPVLVKDRISKGYRVPQLDSRLRVERTRTEARLLSEARRAGVSTPKIVSVDEKAATIVMEFIDGKKLKDALSGMDAKHRATVAQSVGVAVGKLHSAGIVHGDLTTSNMMLARSGEHGNEKVWFIDFGLGFFSDRMEDFGTDIAVLHEALRSTHFNFLDELWQNFLAGYRTSFAGADQALKALEAIEQRGRYVRRTRKS